MKHSATGPKRSMSEPMLSGAYQSNAKLSKPPKVQSIYQRPRKRLQKRNAAMNAMLTPYPTHLGFTTLVSTLYVLEYEPYPYNTLPSEFLGAYSTVDSVTTGAIEHGAYTFSRDGFLDGTEYLTPTGRIRIQTQPLQTVGTEAAVSIRNHSLDERPAKQSSLVRSDIPHPQSRSNTWTNAAAPNMPATGSQSMTSLRGASKPKQIIFLAVRQGPTAAHCLGAFARPGLAWGACLKNKASCALTGTLSEESREADAEGMPRVSARLHGCGQHVWFVAAKEVDCSPR